MNKKILWQYNIPRIQIEQMKRI